MALPRTRRGASSFPSGSGMAREKAGKGSALPLTPPPGPRGQSHGGKITRELHSVTSVFCLFKSPLRLEKEGPRNFRQKKAGISLRGVSTPVLVAGCSRKITLFKYVYSLQGCNYFGISVASSQSSGMRIARLVPYCALAPVMSQRGADMQ